MHFYVFKFFRIPKKKAFAEQKRSLTIAVEAARLSAYSFKKNNERQEQRNVVQFENHETAAAFAN